MPKIFVNKWEKWEAFKNSLYVYDTDELRKNHNELKNLSDDQIHNIIKDYDGDVYLESNDKTVVETMFIEPAIECDHFVQNVEEGTEVFRNEAEWGDGKNSPWPTEGKSLNDWLPTLPHADTTNNF